MVTLLVLVVGLYTMTGTISARTNEFAKTISALQDSLTTLQATIRTLKDQAPGLGEYMTTFQLHMAKLWFAAQSSNWSLAQYEFGELVETKEAAEALHAVKNNVQISAVLQSVRETQAAMLQKSLDSHNKEKFAGAYNMTLQTCNSCHRSVGYGFIHITRPSAPPVTNQAWTFIQ